MAVIHEIKGATIKKLLRKRELTSHKGKNGRLLIIGGSIDYHGAPILAAKAAFRAGADLVYMYVPECNFDVTRAASPDFIVKKYSGEYFSPRAASEIISFGKTCDAVLIGPGLGEKESVLEGVLELIKKQEEESVNIASFLDFFEQARDDELSVNAAGGDSMKVTTIHKSKGLEFGVVIIPFLEMDVQVGSRGSQGGVSYVVSGEEDSIRLLRLKKTYAMYSKELKERYRREYNESFIDELNTIYVAFTRAKNELYVFIPKKVSNKSNVANYLIPPENPERGRMVDYKDKGQKEKTVLTELPPSEYKDWIHILKDEFIDEARLKKRQNLLRGQLLHAVLSFIGNLVGENKDRAVEKARETVGLHFPFADDLADCGLTVKRLLEKPQFKPFFFIEDGTVWQEREIVDSAGLTRRMDRLIVKEKEVWVADYKSARDDPRAHREQIKEYVRLIKDLYPGRQVKGFLIYLDDLSVEKV